MKFLETWRGPRAALAAASGLAIAAASLTIAAPAAHAAVSGFVNGPVDVPNITVSWSGRATVGRSTVTMVPTINGHRHSHR